MRAINLSTRSLSTIEHAARRTARLLDDVATPLTIGIDVELGALGAVRSVTVGESGPLYELDRLDAKTLGEAMVDATGVARSGPRSWRRV